MRPLSLGEIWDGAFRAFRQNPKVMIGLSALVVVVTSLITLFATFAATSDLAGLANSVDASGRGDAGEVFGVLQRSIPVFVVSALLQVVSVLILNGMLIVSVSRAVVGRTIGLAELWRVCRRRLGALVVLSLIITIVGVVAGAVMLAPGVLLAVSSDSGGATAAAVGLILLGAAGWVVLGAWLWVKWSMATPALLLEGLSVRRALGRSYALTKRSFWRTFGILALTTVVVYIVGILVGLPFSLLGGAIGAVTDASSDGAGFKISQSISTVGSIIGNVIGFPFLASVTALVYVDLRMRREGLDVELHRAAAGG
ncbi:MAG: glycerophosphoryl diester phosphodiesterase membrane domain-containing protein [Janthinobacterium lividum]